MTNLDIINFKQKIADTINNSGLPMEVVRMSLGEIISAVNIECQRIIEEEVKEKKNVESVQGNDPDNSVPHNEAD